MSDTPRTDNAQWGTGKVTTDFARSLEREITRLETELRELRLQKPQNDPLNDVRFLRNEVDCRIQHGAEGPGHLEYVRNSLDQILNSHQDP